MKKKFYQILVKGLASNKLVLIEFKDYDAYKDAIEFYKNDEYHVIITINQYWLS